MQLNSMNEQHICNKTGTFMQSPGSNLHYLPGGNYVTSVTVTLQQIPHINHPKHHQSTHQLMQQSESKQVQQTVLQQMQHLTA